MPSADEKLIQAAQKRFQLCQEAEFRLRMDALDDLRFLGGEQWPERIKRDRELDGSPCLTINRLPQFVRQITNAQRQNRISARVTPVDDAADVETAEIIQGIIRHIESQSRADVAYDTAAFYAAAIGFGYWRVVTEYSGPESFEQDIRIRRIRNPFSVYLDPSAQEPDGSDAEFGFISEQLTRDEFKEAYPNADLTSLDDWRAAGDGPKDWVTDDGIRIVEYYYREEQPDTLLLVAGPNGRPLTLLKSEVPEGAEGLTILAERETKIPRIKWCKLTAAEVLDRTEWPGRWIPIVKVVGDELEIDGRLHLHGIVRFAKDPQRQYNYMLSAQTEAIALEPKAPVVGYEGQFEGYEDQWKNANRRKFAYLQVRPTTIGGQPAPFPTRLQANPNIPALTAARAEAADDLKATTGIYDAQLGARANETSGRAILARTQQGEVSNFHYPDNLRRSVEHGCRILVDLIPHIYDTPRVVRIIGEDEKEKVVRVNQQFTERGEVKLYDLTAGRYDVICSAGPSFASKRQQAAEQMVNLAQAFPALMQIAGDILVKALDIPYAQELSDRIKRALPPELREPGEGEGRVPPAAQAKLQQMGQMVEALTKALNEAQDKLEKKQAELESRERIEGAKLAARAAETQARLDSAEAIALLRAEIESIKARLGLNVRQAAEEASATAAEI